MVSFICDQALNSPVAPTPFLPAEYLRAFATTCALEAPFYLGLLRSRGAGRALLILFGSNVLTHPLVYFAFPAAFARAGASYAAFLAAAEAFAALVEIIFVCKVGRRPLVASAAWIGAANLASWWIGALLSAE
jgi:hypothetical protein